MKLKRLELKDYNQFKDLVIDLTYPKGHPKEGQPGVDTFDRTQS